MKKLDLLLIVSSFRCNQLWIAIVVQLSNIKNQSSKKHSINQSVNIILILTVCQFIATFKNKINKFLANSQIYLKYSNNKQVTSNQQRVHRTSNINHMLDLIKVKRDMITHWTMWKFRIRPILLSFLKPINQLRLKIVLYLDIHQAKTTMIIIAEMLIMLLEVNRADQDLK